jgi:hypothetical protein
MAIERDKGDQRPTQLDRMIAEFRDAQTRRYAKVNDNVTESKPDPNTPTPVAGSAAPR